MTARRALLGILLVWLASAPSGAGTHRVRGGESLAGIAKEEFGDSGLADLLGLHNGLAPGTRLRADVRLDLPEARVVRVMRPQTFAELSERTLGSAQYAPLLAALNRRDLKESLGFGMQIVIPALLDHRPGPDEDLAAIASLFYGDPGRTWLLELANPSRARTVKVPVVGFFKESLSAAEVDVVKLARKQLTREPRTAAGAKPAGDPAPATPPDAGPPTAPAAGQAPAAASERVARQTPPAAAPPALPPRQAAKSPKPALIPRPAAAPTTPPARPDGREGEGARPELPAPPAPPAAVTVDVPRPAIPERILWQPLEEARRAVQDGDYHRAQVDITALLDSGRVPRDLRPQAWLLLGLSRLARGESGAARVAFAQVRKLNPSLDLDSFYYSPKVRAAFAAAGKP